MFPYYDRKLIDIRGIGSRGFAISQGGVVAGYFTQREPSTPNHAAVQRRGTDQKDAGSRNARRSFKLWEGHQHSNHVVGYSTLTSGCNPHAFVYNRGKLINLGALAPLESGSDYSVAVRYQ